MSSSLEHALQGARTEVKCEFRICSFGIASSKSEIAMTDIAIQVGNLGDGTKLPKG